MLLLEHGGAGVGGLSFSPDGKMLAVCGGGRVTVWNHLTGELLHEPAVRHSVRCLAFTTRTVLVMAGDLVSRWTPSRGTSLLRTGLETSPVVAVCASKSGRTMFYAGNNRRTHYGIVLRLPQGRGKQYLTVQDNFINDIALEPGAINVAVAASGMLLQWNASASKTLMTSWTQRIPSNQPSRSSIPSIARLEGDGGGEILDVDRDFRCVAYAPDGGRLAAAVEKDLEVWDAADARKLATLSQHDADVRAVAYSPDGRWLASGGDDETVVCYDLIRGRVVARYNWSIGGVRCIAFAPDGLTVAAAGEEAVAVWDVEEPSS
jgi:WD40 repeat protein